VKKPAAATQRRVVAGDSSRNGSQPCQSMFGPSKAIRGRDPLSYLYFRAWDYIREY
jgi:hypothetical protein